MANNTSPARVRFAPSPTGLTHLGSARTALYNYLLAHQTGGQFILRIEDTDQKRYDPNAEQDLKDSLRWLGLEWDEGPDAKQPSPQYPRWDYNGSYRQSDRMREYREQAEKLVEMGKAFYCFCTPAELEAERKAQQARKEQPHYSGKCRTIPPAEAKERVANGETHVVRFKSPKEGSITVVDELRGPITVENRTIDDRVLLKSDGHAVYHLAAMVDDHQMGITHVLRGEEWLPSLPLHVHIYEAFGWQQPKWVHLSVFLKPSGKGKMSKRETEAMKLTGQSIFIRDLKESGYLPEGVINWIALMGWSYDDKTEFFTLQDLVEKFDIGKLNPSPAAIDFKKLDHFNGLHIRKLDNSEFSRRIKPFFEKAGYPVKDKQPFLADLAPLIRERIVTLDDAPEIAGFFFLTDDEFSVPRENLIIKDKTPTESAEILEEALKALKDMPKLTIEELEARMRVVAEEQGIKAGALFTQLRNAVTGQQVSPPLFETMKLIGSNRVLKRIGAGVEGLEAA